MMGLGMMIGAGVFLGIGNAVHVAGPGGVLLTFALNGVVAMFTALSYAELSSAIPRAGGAYNFARLAFGRGNSFVAGWMEWFASSVAGSLYSVTFAIYLVRYFNGLGLLDSLPLSIYALEKIVAFVIALVFLGINYRGASETGKIGAFFTLGQTLFLILIGLIGVIVVMRDPSRLANLSPFMPHGWSKLMVTMGFTYVAFEGYEVIAQTGDEAIDPRRNLPKAMIYSVAIVTVTYVLVTFATLVSVHADSVGAEYTPWEWIGSHRERGFGEAVSRLMPFGNFLLTLAVIFASTSALNATIYSATRASYALGRDRMLPGLFAAISRKRKTPWGALMFTGIIVIAVAILLPTMDVASSASIMFLFLFFLVNLCVVKIRLNMGDELTYGFVMPFFPWLPIIAVAVQGILAVWIVHMSLIAWLVAPVWVIAGIVIYHAYSKHHAVTTEEEITVLEEEEASVSGGYNIMVAVANPENALSLVRTTYLIGQAKNASIQLLHMVPVPGQVSLKHADRFMMEGKEGIVEAMLYLVMQFPIMTTVRYCRNIARGIVSAVREKSADMLIMGWHGETRQYGFLLGSTLDTVIERSPCDVVILKDCGNQAFKRILVPLAGGPNGVLALEIASILAAKDNGEIVSFTVNSDRNNLDIRRLVELSEQHRNISLDRITTKSVVADSPVDAILAEAEHYDLVILGATGDSLISQVTRESVTHAVAKRCTKPLVIVKAAAGFKSWMKHWL